MRRASLVALLLPGVLLLGGCGSSKGTPTSTPSSDGFPWIVVNTGSATPSPVPSYSYASRSPFPSGFLPLPSGTTTPTPTPSSTCTSGQFHAGTINYAAAVPGTTSAVVTWNNPGGDGLVEYRVTAISQDLLPGDQRDVGWTVVTPATGSCGSLSATVGNLSRRTEYVFSVDAVFTETNKDGTRSVTVARSQPISTT
ncbi:fibronectin type III domain-containing protein [Micromonosporaceae bacterium Da 78-11]